MAHVWTGPLRMRYQASACMRQPLLNGNGRARVIVGIAIASIALLWVGATVLQTPTGAAVFSLGFGLLMLHGAVSDRRKAHLVSEAPTAKANAAAIGLAELHGRASIDDPTAAPFSNRSCVYWHAWVERRVAATRNESERWARVGGRRSGGLSPFRLTDESGSIWVWPVGSQLIIDPERWESSRHALDVLPRGARDLLGELGVTWPGSRDAEALRVSELRIEQDGMMYVLGTIDERGRLPVGLWESGYGQRGHTKAASPELLETLGRLKRTPVDDLTPQWTEPPALAAEQVVVWQGTNDRPFVISDRPEKRVLRTLRTGIALKSGIGALMLLGAVYALARIWGAP
jgi:hypothetical protein